MRERQEYLQTGIGKTSHKDSRLFLCIIIEENSKYEIRIRRDKKIKIVFNNGRQKQLERTKNMTMNDVKKQSQLAQLVRGMTNIENYLPKKKLIKKKVTKKFKEQQIKIKDM